MNTDLWVLLLYLAGCPCKACSRFPFNGGSLLSAGLRLGMERQGEDFPLRRVNDDVKVLEGVHAYLASAACSRHGEGKAVHLEVRPHAEGGGYAQLLDVAVPAVSVDVGGLGRELVSICRRKLQYSIVHQGYCRPLFYEYFVFLRPLPPSSR